MANVTSANVRTIAKEAGVSHITVSRALRNSPHVAAATRAKVVEVAERMGYRPNPLVQAYAAQIRRGKGEAAECNLAWLESDIGEVRTPLWLARYLQGAKARAEELGYPLDVGLNAHDYGDERLEKLLEARGIRGVVIPFSAYQHRTPFQSGSMVTVGIGETPAAEPMHTVRPDYFRNMTTAIDAALSLRYERIGYAEHDAAAVESQGELLGGFLWNQLRWQGKRRLRPLSGLRPEFEESRKRFLHWFDGVKPDCVICPFNQARQWLEEKGLNVPGDVGVVHMGLGPDTDGWSGISYSGEVIGSAAIDLLAAHIIRNEYGIPEIPKLMRIPGSWIPGATTRKPPKNRKVEPPASHNHPLEWFEQNLWGRHS